MRTVKLNEEQIKQLESILGEVPMKWASPIMQVLTSGLQAAELTNHSFNDPVIGGGGSGAKPPKKSE
jgi:hypothetical protein